jgi:geranylgeranyl diphosphate synthase type I
MTKIPQGLAEYRAVLDDTLQAVMNNARGRFPDLSDRSAKCFELLTEYVLRPGKRIRGSLLAAAYDDAAGEDRFHEIGLRAGAALEIVQAYLLMVDDVMDESQLRRGKPTVHRLYEELFRSSPREAEMATILLGAITQTIATDTICALEAPTDVVREVVRWLHYDIALTNIGQLDDISQTAVNRPAYADMVRRYQQKTSYYTFVGPITIGRTLAGEEDVRTKAEAFGVPAGMAFQLSDDILGIFGEPEVTGKSNLDDMQEGKYTFLVHYALEGVDASQYAQLMTILGDRSAGEQELSIVREIIETTGALTRVKADAMSYADSAVRATEVWPGAFGELLTEIVRFSTERGV